MEKADDQYYIDAVKEGNVAAFSFLVEKYQKLVYTLALKLMKKPEEAEEMAQDTFIKAYQKIDTYEGKSKFSTWLYSITYNACISELRKRRIDFRSLDDEDVVQLGAQTGGRPVRAAREHAQGPHRGTHARRDASGGSGARKRRRAQHCTHAERNAYLERR